MKRLALLTVLLFATTAQAQPIRFIGPDTLDVIWRPAENATYYELVIYYMDGTTSGPITASHPNAPDWPQTTIWPRMGIPFHVQVVACDADGCRVPSDMSTEAMLCWRPSDVSCDGVVGFGDYNLVIDEWGQQR